MPDMTKVTKKNGEYTYKELKFKERSDAVFFNRAMRNKTIAPLLSNILSPPSDPPDPPVGPEDRDEVLRAAEQCPLSLSTRWRWVSSATSSGA